MRPRQPHIGEPVQILIDDATETPGSLLDAARLINQWAAMKLLRETNPYHGMEPIKAESSINGPGEKITLTGIDLPAEGFPVNATFVVPDAPVVSTAFDAHMVLTVRKDAAPLNAASTIPPMFADRDKDAETPPGYPDPKVVFGRFSGTYVPAGTNVDPTPAAPDAPAAPVMNAGAVAAAGTLTAPPAPTTPAVNTAVSTDARGTPWDARVHSETRKTNADGSWRFRRNLDEAVKAAVMAELRGPVQRVPILVGPNSGLHPEQVQLPDVGGSSGLVMLTGQLPLSPEAPPVPLVHVSSNTLPVAPDAPNAPVSLPGSLPLLAGATLGVSDAPNPPVVSAPVTSFRELMSRINIARSRGQLTQEHVDAACRAANVGSITELAAQPSLVPAVNAQIDRYLGVAA